MRIGERDKFWKRVSLWKSKEKFSYFRIEGIDDDADRCIHSRIYFYEDDAIRFEWDLGSSWETIIELEVPTTWHSIQFQLTESSIRVKVDNFNWSAWQELYADCDGLSLFQLVDGHENYAQYNEFYFDSFTQGEGYGICGSDEDCLYCDNQTDCENNDCYWIQLPFPFVWVCSPYSGIIQTATGTQYDFSSYYASNSQFTTPTDFINRLASATQPFLVTLSSWLENFSDLFDLSEAQEKGEQLGNAIPKARGYLAFFDGLFADLPLSGILLIYLVILIGIIIFRIIRQIKKLIAF